MAVSILDGIKDKAKNLLNLSEPYVTRQTNIYNASNNKVFVAGIPIDSMVTTVISADVITKQETGIDYYYTAIHQVIEQRTLTVTVLPTADCLPLLRVLALKQQQTKGWFNISVHENDNIVNVYRGWILELPEIGMQQEAADRSITFGIKPMHSGISVIDQPTKFEEQQYSKYGVSPDLGGSNRRSTINESSGQLQDEPYIPLPTESLVEPYDDGIRDFTPVYDNIDDGT